MNFQTCLIDICDDESITLSPGDTTFDIQIKLERKYGVGCNVLFYKKCKYNIIYFLVLLHCSKNEFLQGRRMYENIRIYDVTNATQTLQTICYNFVKYNIRSAKNILPDSIIYTLQSYYKMRFKHNYHELRYINNIEDQMHYHRIYRTYKTTIILSIKQIPEVRYYNIKYIRTKIVCSMTNNKCCINNEISFYNKFITIIMIFSCYILLYCIFKYCIL